VAVQVPPAGEPDAATQPVEFQFQCDAEVSVTGSEVFGEADREGPGDLSEEAWRKVCEILRTKHGVDCEQDRDTIRVSRSQRMSIVNGKMTQSLRIGVKPIVARPKAKAGSDASQHEACLEAIDEACSQAPPDTECVKVGVGCEADPADPSHWHCSPRLMTNGIVEPPSLFGAEPGTN